MNVVKPINSPIIDMLVNDKLCKSMVDTGSTVSIVDIEFLQRLGLSKKFWRETDVKIQCFLNQPIQVLGSISLRLGFGTNIVNHDFLIIPSGFMSTFLLIGFDLLSKFPFSWSTNVLTWNGKQFRVDRNKIMSVHKIQLLKNQLNIVVDKSMKVKKKELIFYKTNKYLIPNTLYMVQSKLCDSKFKVHLLGKHFLLETDDCGNLEIPIYSVNGFYIRNGTLIATVESVDRSEVVNLDIKGKPIDIKQIIENCNDFSNINLCKNHTCLTRKYLLDSGAVIIETSIVDCYICNSMFNQINNIQSPIRNEMIPHMDVPTEVFHSKEDKLLNLFQKLELNHLRKTEVEKLKQVILKNVDLFVLSEKDIGLINLPDNHISMLDKDPVRFPLYRHPEKAKEIITEMIQNMLDKDIIEESYAVYLSPIVLINKPDGKKRMCIDYRGVNKHIKLDIHPLPRLDELVEEVAGNKYYCTLDLKDAYYQCKLDEESRDVTTFSDGKNLYRFKRLPFGLSVAPAIFTRVMQEVLKPLIKLGWCRNYLDDVIIYAPDFETLINRLNLTFQRMLEMGLKLNVSKCSFAQRKIKFLGHFVSEKGIEVNPEHISAIKQRNPPKSTKEVRQFIGMCSFYRKYIKDFSKISSPLTALQSKKVKFVWNEVCQKAFEELKEKLCNTPVLTKVDLTKDFELHSDASNENVGAVLMQREQEGLKPIGYFSKKLNKCEKKYSVTDKEALAIVKACRFFHHYLWGKHFKIVTDHQPLTSIFKKRTHSPRMSRYMLEMRDYCFDIVYHKGKTNHVPDALSRPSKLTPMVRLINNEENIFKFPGLTPEIIKNEQRKESRWKKIIDFCEGGKIPNKTPGNRTLDCFEVRDGILYLRREEFKRLTYCLVIPDSLKAVACSVVHNETHLGQHKTVRKAQQYFYWPRLWQDVVDFVKSCKTCQQFRKEGALVHKWCELPTVTEKGVRIAIDLIDLLNSSTGHRYCLTVIDHFSRFIRAYPLRNKNFNSIIKALKQDLSIFGIPQIALSDNGSEFTNSEFRKYCKQVGIQQVMCLPYHPRGNSVLERAHRTLKSVLAMLSKEHPNRWPVYLPESVRILNESVHTSLGTSPFFVQFGYHPIRVVGTLLLPEEMEGNLNSQNLELKQKIKETIEAQTAIYRDRANIKRENSNRLKVGELAWVYVEEPIPGTAVKLNRKWKGPFKVVKVIGNGRAYELENCFDGKLIQRAAGKLKLYIARKEVLDKIDETWLTELEQNQILPSVRGRKPPDRLQY